MPSPVRRSIRGAPPPAAKPAPPTSTNSSSSLSSSRQDRTARGKEASHPRSLSSEDVDDGPPRRSARAHKEDPAREAEADLDDDAGDEEEVTRCICGYAEYPGPSPESEAFAGMPNAQAEDAGGFFVCCDGCSVWQHGGCAGIADEGIVHGQFKYWCEQCKPKLHELHTDSRGQNYSLYLPLHPKAHRKSSVGRDDDKVKKPISRASVDPSTGRRRGTTRSKEHDDEEEQLKRAIEESKREAEGNLNSNNKKNGKRGRDDSDDSKPLIKRQRTTSMSMTSATRADSVDDDSDDDAETNTANRSKRAKQDAVQSARQAAQQEKDKERDKARAEAAGRRQERAGRRRGDEADLDDATPKPNSSSRDSPPVPSSQPDSPPPADKVSHKKGAGKKVRKLGNNQYTKYRTEPGMASSPHGRRRHLQNQGAGSGDEASEGLANGEGNGSSNGGTGKASPSAEPQVNGRGKFGKGKKAAAPNGGPPMEVEKTFTNMKGAVDAMSAWIARQQLDIPLPVSASSGSERSPGNGEEALLKAGGAVRSPGGDGLLQRPFEELSLEEMAIVLQKGFEGWNQEYGQYAQQQAVG